MEVAVPQQNSEKALDDDCPDCDKDEKAQKYLALFTNDEGFLQYTTAPSSVTLKKMLEKVPIDHVVLIWKGKPKTVKTKSVITF